jgi:hypothetical protein
MPDFGRACDWQTLKISLQQAVVRVRTVIIRCSEIPVILHYYDNSFHLKIRTHLITRIQQVTVITWYVERTDSCGHHFPRGQSNLTTALHSVHTIQAQLLHYASLLDRSHPTLPLIQPSSGLSWPLCVSPRLVLGSLQLVQFVSPFQFAGSRLQSLQKISSSHWTLSLTGMLDQMIMRPSLCFQSWALTPWSLF